MKGLQILEERHTLQTRANGEINDFFNAAGRPKLGITLQASDTFEQNVKAMAEHYNDGIKPGHGLFLDFSLTPEYEKPFIHYMITHFGWKLEQPFFIRRPEPLQPWGEISGNAFQYTLHYN
jgi:hypothetical protein